MNYLAHFQLAGHHSDLLAGALLGDYVRGPLKGEFGEGVEAGIELHRRIDAYTDSFIREARVHEHFDPAMRRILGIVIDVYFDHLLSRRWHDYEKRSIAEFQSATLRCLRDYTELFPPKAAEMYQRLRDYQFLTIYADADMLPRIYRRIASRLHNNPHIIKASPALIANDEKLSRLFDTLYPQLTELAQSYS